MKKEVVRIVVIGGIIITTFALLAVHYHRSQNREREQVAELAKKARDSVFVRPHSRSLGPPDAKVTVVEFLDPECESCRAMYPMVKQLLGQYGDRVRLVVRYMPFHANSIYAAGVLEAAGEQGRYWEMLEILFQYQPEWGSHHAPRPDLIPGYARQIGLDMDAVDRFLRAGGHRAIVEIDAADGRRLQVTGTPTFFVNGRLLENLGYDPLRALIEEELAK
jgi:protein-disulfide isomerase